MAWRLWLIILALWAGAPPQSRAEAVMEPGFLRTIVKFSDYASLGTLRRRVVALIGRPRASLWTFVGTGGPGSRGGRIPTDFVTVGVIPGGLEAFHVLVGRGGGVTGVFPDGSVRTPLALLCDRGGADEAACARLNATAAGAAKEGATKGVRRRLMGPVKHSSHRHGHLRGRKPLNGIITSHAGKPLRDHGIRGKGVKVAVFDTGLNPSPGLFKRVVERVNWTNERKLGDKIGHGTFVAGVIASTFARCPGWAPEAELHIFRVFTDKQFSYTSWFLDAFNYAIWRGIHVLNLSIGGPDGGDRPFVDKVRELSANGIVVVSAIGNDGPLYGTLNNPADQYDTIGVGGLTRELGMARFSSRGMTTGELPFGYGRFKPDISTFGQSVIGLTGGPDCKGMSGTSVASPVIAGAVTLLMSVPPQPSPLMHRDKQGTLRFPPAAIKQALIESAHRIHGLHIFEQGAGQLNVTGAWDVLKAYTPRASFQPATLDLTDCPYMWPFCSQPLYATAQPVVANLTLINGIAVAGEVSAVAWEVAEAKGGSADLVEIKYEHPDFIWPWAGYFAVWIRVLPAAAHFSGTVHGTLTVTLRCWVSESNSYVEQDLHLPITVGIVPQPPRARRLLWDQFHSISYPSGYFPRDNLKVAGEMLDWTGDHPHTNFRDFYTLLRSEGYFLEVLSESWSCFDAANYAALLVVDPEEDLFPTEIDKLETDVRERGLSVVVIADWYSRGLMRSVRFFDDNTRSDWHPVTGGCNVPALNELLGRFGVAFGERVFEGVWSFSQRESVQYLTGTSLIRFPSTGYVRVAPALKERVPGSKNLRGAASTKAQARIMGMVNACETPGGCREAGSGGNVVVYGDSSCFDSWGSQKALCSTLGHALMLAATDRAPTTMYSHLFRPSDRVGESMKEVEASELMPERRGSTAGMESEMFKYSNVLQQQGEGAGMAVPRGEVCDWSTRLARPSNGGGQRRA